MGTRNLDVLLKMIRVQCGMQQDNITDHCAKSTIPTAYSLSSANQDSNKFWPIIPQRESRNVAPCWAACCNKKGKGKEFFMSVWGTKMSH